MRSANGVVERPPTLTPGRRLGRYQIRARIGAGRTAEVWLATVEGIRGFSRSVVLKTLRPELAADAEMVSLFVREASIAAELAHPRVVRVRELGTVDGIYFMEMEHAPGCTLRQLEQRMKERLALIPVPVTLLLMIDACDGLEYVHRRADAAGRPLGLVHRDVSPENLLVTFGGTVEVFDFGLVACALGDEPAALRRWRGRPQYSAPEARGGGGPSSPREDVYALGVVLYELLTGRRPPLRRGPEQEAPPPPSVFNEEVSDRLDRVVLQASASAPGARPRDAGALGLALREELAATGAILHRGRLGAALASLFPERDEVPAPIRAMEQESIDLLESGAPPASPGSVEIELFTADLLEDLAEELLPEGAAEEEEVLLDAFAEGAGEEERAARAAELHFDRGLELVLAGELEAALVEWEAALELAPGQRKYQANLMRLRQKMEEAR